MYTERNILKLDPFQTLDKDGVGKLIEMAVKQAKKVNENIKIGVCGELGGDANLFIISITYQLIMYHVHHSEFQEQF